MRGLSSTFAAWRQHFTPKQEIRIPHRRVDAHTFRQFMREIAAPVAIVAAGSPGGRNGLTATAVCTVTDNPPTILTCVQQKTFAHGAVMQSQYFSINFLSADQKAVAVQFAGGNGISGEERFTIGGWCEGVTGAPLLPGAACTLECHLVDYQAVATHTIFFGELVAGNRQENAENLLYQRGEFTSFSSSLAEYAECQE